MEKYARQALSEGVKSEQDLQIHEDSELYRVLNVHYNRNNHIEVSALKALYTYINTLVLCSTRALLVYGNLILHVNQSTMLGKCRANYEKLFPCAAAALCANGKV